MGLRVLLGLSLVGLTYLGLSEAGSRRDAPIEVPMSLTETLVGGAACPGLLAVECEGQDITACPNAYCLRPTINTSGNCLCNATLRQYCGCSKSCSSRIYYAGKYSCATTTVVVAEAAR